MVWACHINSPRQKLAISSERNVNIPGAVKIGCDHQSENCFVVHPSNSAFEAAPVKSPKCVFIQKSQATIGIAAQTASAPSGGISPRSLPARASRMHHHKIAPTATIISGRLLSFVRYAAAIERNKLARGRHYRFHKMHLEGWRRSEAERQVSAQFARETSNGPP